MHVLSMALSDFRVSLSLYNQKHHFVVIFKNSVLILTEEFSLLRYMVKREHMF